VADHGNASTSLIDLIITGMIRSLSGIS